MKHKFLLLCLVFWLATVCGQHENIPYQQVANICETCVCLTTRDNEGRQHHMLNCFMKNFEHILARWPSEFGTQHLYMEMGVIYSGNKIRLLQQLPATNATLTLACNRCGLQQLQAPLFMDVPNVETLSLSGNELKADALKPDLFRGPFKSTKYEPIGLKNLDLSHNSIDMLDRKLFEHTPLLAHLNLAHNQLSVLDAATTVALASIANLQRLDLSGNGLVTLPTQLFISLGNLRSLELTDNAFTKVPASIQQLGKSLQQLNLAGNALTSLSSDSFTQLHALRRLNISDMATLRTVQNGTFGDLHALERLDCARNPKLERLDFNSLQSSRNLSQLDFSQNALTTLALNLSYGNSSSLQLAWPRLRKFYIQGNPWTCSCELLQTLELAGSPHLQETQGASRCDTPYMLAGVRLSNLTADYICNMVIPKKYLAVDEDPPRFLRRRYIILTAIIASVVVVLGLLIGFIVVCVRRRLKGDDYGVQPIRYTSVRGSNLSAFSQLQPPSAISKFSTAPPATITGAANA